MWANFDSKAYTREEFRSRINGLTWSTWKPEGVTLHNTAAPTLAQWAESGPSHDARIRNLESFYEHEKGWHAGPHAFISRDFINGFSNILRPGVHSRCYNATRFGLEMVGDYAKEHFEDGDGAKVRDNAIFAVAVLNLKHGFKAQDITFHKECHQDNHDCPGRLVIKSEFIRRVNDKMAELRGTPIIAPEPPGNPIIVPADPVDGYVLIDGLNIRSGASVQSIIVAVAHADDVVRIVGEAMNGSTKWYKVELPSQSKSGYAAARYISKGMPPAGDVDEWQTGILATCFGGPEEPDYPMASAYGGRVNDKAAEVAVPFRFEGTRPLVECRTRGPGPIAVGVGKINDVGPWNKRDAYWEEGDGGNTQDTDGRPDAEWQFKHRTPAQNGRIPTNQAGIDLTPGFFRALGINPKVGSVLVDWRFRKAA